MDPALGAANMQAGLAQLCLHIQPGKASWVAEPRDGLDSQKGSQVNRAGAGRGYPPTLGPTALLCPYFQDDDPDHRPIEHAGASG